MSSARDDRATETRRIVVWGTYDVGKPRTRLLLTSIANSSHEIIEIHKDVWGTIADKSQVSGYLAKARFGLLLLLAYPGLIWRYLRAPDHDIVVIPYLGHFDILIIWPLAKLRGAKIVWDAFLSLYDTIVTDRGLAKPRGMIAKLVHLWESLACKAADTIVLDTHAQTEMFVTNFDVDPVKLASVPVGAEARAFPLVGAGRRERAGNVTRILFYGQFIPLHGISTIIEAAQIGRDSPYHWVIIGEGQESALIDRMIASGPSLSLERKSWVPYDELISEIANSDICLGIFGTSEKAARVIPNKVYQILNAGRPLVTRQSPGMAELLTGDEKAIRLIPPGNPEALLQAIGSLVEELAAMPKTSHPLHREITEKFCEGELIQRWSKVIDEAAKNR